MSLYDNMIKSKGEVCRWLTDDDMFHMLDCLLNKVRMNVLSDRFAELNLKHPSFAWEYMDDYCKYENCPYFEPRKEDDNRPITKEEVVSRIGKEIGDYEDESDYELMYTRLEVAATEIAKKEFADDNTVRNIYKEIKNKVIAKRLKDIDQKINELVLLQEEKEF